MGKIVLIVAVIFFILAMAVLGPILGLVTSGIGAILGLPWIWLVILGGLAYWGLPRLFN